jgi:outer membrane protein assembly factor BamB
MVLSVLCLAMMMQAPASGEAPGGDWPTYMHDSARTGASPADVKLPLGLAWSYKAHNAPQPAWPPPAKDDLFHRKFNLAPRVTYDHAFHLVGAAGSVYFASSADDKVYCLDAQTGREKWAFYAEGPVRLAPTIADGKLLFGSDDGYVYCLNASDGALVWKLRAAPQDRRIPGNERVISAWPVRTGVLVDGQRGHFCAGLFAVDGIYYQVVDIATGKKLDDKKITESAQGYLELRGNRVFAPAGRKQKGVFLDNLAAAGPAVQATGMNALPKYPYAGVTTASLRFCGGDGQVAAVTADGKQELWSAKVDGKALSMAVVADRLLVSTDRGMIYCFASNAGDARRVEPPPAAPMVYPSEAVRKQYAAAAEKIINQTPRRKGYCLVLNSGEGYLARELAGLSEFKIVCLESSPAKVASSRAALDGAGLYGRVVVHHGSAETLPYADYMFNLVVHDAAALDQAFVGSRAEALRVTSPSGGVAVFSLSKPDVVRPAPLEGAGRWSHFYADAGNSACSQDKLVRGEMAVQWFGRPGPRSMIDRHNRGVAPLYVNGRLFVSGYDYIAAIDAYNGTVLWERDLPGSTRAISLKNCGNMAATDDLLYVAAKERCLALEPDTGKTVGEFSVPSGGGDWGYVACVDGVLLGSQTKGGASRFGSDQGSWAAGYSPLRPVVCSDSLFAFDRSSGRKLWSYAAAQGVIANPTVAVGDGRVYFVESTNPQTRNVANGRVDLPTLLGKGAELVALDLRSGKALWRAPAKTALQHALYLSFAHGTLVLSGTKVSGRAINYDLHAFDAGTGKAIWEITHAPAGMKDISGSHGEITQHPAVVGKTIYLCEAAFDLRTGQRLAGWAWNRGGHGCGTLSSSGTALFYRGGNPQMTELATGKQTRLTCETRPGCWINVIPAGGLVLIPEGSSGCTCDYAIQTSIALAPVARRSE